MLFYTRTQDASVSRVFLSPVSVIAAMRHGTDEARAFSGTMSVYGIASPRAPSGLDETPIQRSMAPKACRRVSVDCLDEALWQGTVPIWRPLPVNGRLIRRRSSIVVDGVCSLHWRRKRGVSSKTKDEKRLKIPTASPRVGNACVCYVHSSLCRSVSFVCVSVCLAFCRDGERTASSSRYADGRRTYNDGGSDQALQPTGHPPAPRSRGAGVHSMDLCVWRSLKSLSGSVTVDRWQLIS